MNNHKLFMIKLVHTVIFVIQWGFLLYLLYAAVTRTYHWLALVAIGSLMINGVALLRNRWRCPLTTLAERYGAERGAVSDIFLPRLLARNMFKYLTVVFAAELALLAFGYFTR